MTFQERMRMMGYTDYRLAKESGVPISTILRMRNGKAQIENCTAKNVCLVARVLQTTAEELVFEGEIGSLSKAP